MKKRKTELNRRRLQLAALMVFSAILATCAEAGLKTWDVGDYVQNGLIAHYDAIRNVGAALPHDDSAASWADLSPTGGSAANLACVYGGNGSWVSNAYVFAGKSCMQMQQKLTLGSEFTIQIASDIDMSVDGRTRPTVFASGDNFHFITDRSYDAVSESTSLAWRTTTYSGITQGNSPTVQWSDGKYVNAAFGDGRAYITTGVAWPAGTQFVNADVSVPELTYTFGGRFAGGSSGGRNYCSIGKFHALRIYKRKLTNEELAWNRAIDEIRYRGATELPVTNVVVAADALGLCGAEMPGAYAVDGSHSFTASTGAANGCVYAAAGYLIEEWDPDASAWGEAVAYDGVRYDYSTNSSPAKVRLTWRWKMTDGIMRYDVGDYVQNGLIAHYDAIRNVGAGLPHDDGAASWADLSPTGGSAANKACTYGGNGSWVSNAYVFAGKSCMQMQQTLTLGSEFTIQIASDIDMSVDGRTRPTVFASDDNFHFITDRSWDAVSESMSLAWRTTTYSGITSGNSPTVQWSDGKYVNAAFGDGRAYLTTGVAWPAGTRFVNADVSVPELTYTFGGRYVGGSSGERNYCSIGKFHALRIYNRKLTNEELAWNRDVDEVRYRGAESTASNTVWVTTSRRGCAGSESGAYRLVGEYTFTASAATVNGVEYNPVGYTVETWNKSTGEWNNKEHGIGSSCVLCAGDSQPARRLTWKFQSGRGLVITFM